MRILRGSLPDRIININTSDGYGYGAGGDGGDGYGGYGGDGAVDEDGPHYWRTLFSRTVAQWPTAQQQRLEAVQYTAELIAFWKSDRNGFPCNGGDPLSSPAAPGVLHEIPGPLIICTNQALHATMHPEKWKGERLWVVALYGEVQWKDDKSAALRREIIGEIPLKKEV